MGDWSALDNARYNQASDGPWSPEGYLRILVMLRMEADIISDFYIGEKQYYSNTNPEQQCPVNHANMTKDI